MDDECGTPSWRCFDLERTANHRKALTNPQPGQKAERWFAVFPSDHATCDRKVLRGWFLRALLKNAAVRVGSGVNFDTIKEWEKAYYKAGRPGSPTEIV